MSSVNSTSTTPDVDANELVFRQVGPGGNPLWFDPDRPIPLYHALLLPSSDDTDGLSLIRERFRSKVWAAFRPHRNNVNFRLIVLKVKSLQDHAVAMQMSEFNLMASPDALDDVHGHPWAHCVAVQINRKDYDTLPHVRKQIKAWARQVSSSLQLVCVTEPFESPSSDDPYRPRK